MIISDKEKDTILVSGKLDDVITEFMAIFDELYSTCPQEYKTVLLQFVLDKSTGKFDEEYPLC